MEIMFESQERKKESNYFLEITHTLTLNIYYHNKLILSALLEGCETQKRFRLWMITNESEHLFKVVLVCRKDMLQLNKKKIINTLTTVLTSIISLLPLQRCYFE